MNHTTELGFERLRSEYSGSKGAFICCASFEERSLLTPRHLSSQSFSDVNIIATEEGPESIRNNAQKIKEYFSPLAHISYTKKANPLVSANILATWVQYIINKGTQHLTIDITTFTHEILLILISILGKRSTQFEEITCLYTGASDYSTQEPVERKWLSKGCSEIRSVIGFPGRPLPGRDTCLLVFVGYEHERASRMIADIDPDVLLLGKGIASDDHVTHKSHRSPMSHFSKLIDEMVASRANVTRFEFSPRNVDQSIAMILRMTEQQKDSNCILVPLNTKISTLSIALAALRNPSLQVCYAEAEAYNYDDYSSPDDKVTLIDLKSLLNG